ncbi:MAG: oligosaccharide flippase family protein [Verrucomicrobiota bacterium]
MAEWQRRFWNTVVSGYVSLVVRILTGLLTFRLMFSSLSGEQFGFWALLWSLFGYGILLDFGFGFTAQKGVAEKIATGKLDELSPLLATMFWTYVGMALVSAVVFIVIREPFLAMIGHNLGADPEFVRTYIIFFLGLAVMFPLGLFPEVVCGMQRADITNWISAICSLLGFGAMWWALHCGWSLSKLMLLSIATGSLPNLIAAAYSLRNLPGLSLSPRWFRWRTIRAKMSFSLVAYLITFSNMLMSKSDQLVISMALGVAFVAVYQAAFKTSEMLGMFTSQLQRMLSPAAASFHALGDRDGLRHLLLTSSRLIFLLTTPAYFLAAVYLHQLIRLITGLDGVSQETWLSGQALLLATYSSQLTGGASKRVLVMTGGERKLLMISLAEAGLNVVLSVILAYRFGVVGVALGTLVPSVLMGWLWVVPLSSKSLEIDWKTYLRHHMKGTVAPLAGFAVVLLVIVVAAPAASDAGLFGLAWRGLACVAPVLILGRRTVCQVAA